MNTTQTIVEATKFACKNLGLTIVSDEEAKSIIGKSFVEVVHEIVPSLANNPALLQKFTAIYENYLNEHTKNNPLFESVLEVLEKLTEEKKLLAVATGRSRAMLEDIFDSTGCRKYFVVSKTACECFSKPHPQMIEEILEFTGVAPKDAIMIGDTSHDINMAHNAGIDALAVSHGAQSKELLKESRPKFLLNNITELYELICTN